ncbi:F-box/kelch-repeat protein At3g06240-like [Coffea eugenioides]|uniref:F-box/kelch-repeat protein At3g06240-like n=1 Tax=Coffea eugenioides TaxID=49369 RepID=UPI000F60A0F0|nr:F-box/kelch-repeat protein At3g06240-like [Coffea eugenioides]
MLVVLVENPSIEVMIYNLNSNSWKVLDSPFEGATAFDDQVRGVFIGKALHWVMRDWNFMDVFVVAFDLQTEQFYSMLLPKYPDVFIGRYPTYVVDMWVMRKYTDEDSWFKYTLKLPICKLYTSVVPIALTKGYHHHVLLQIMFDSFNEKSNSLLLYNLKRRSATFLHNPVTLSTLAACMSDANNEDIVITITDVEATKTVAE